MPALKGREANRMQAGGGLCSRKRACTHTLSHSHAFQPQAEEPEPPSWGPSQPWQLLVFCRASPARLPC